MRLLGGVGLTGPDRYGVGFSLYGIIQMAPFPRGPASNLDLPTWRLCVSAFYFPIGNNTDLDGAVSRGTLGRYIAPCSALSGFGPINCHISEARTPTNVVSGWCIPS